MKKKNENIHLLVCGAVACERRRAIESNPFTWAFRHTHTIFPSIIFRTPFTDLPLCLSHIIYNIHIIWRFVDNFSFLSSFLPLSPSLVWFQFCVVHTPHVKSQKCLFHHYFSLSLFDINWVFLLVSLPLSLSHTPFVLLWSWFQFNWHCQWENEEIAAVCHRIYCE